jgi:hypothetical protein
MANNTPYELVGKWLDGQVVPPLRLQIVGRPLFEKVTFVPQNKYNIDYFKFTDLGSAQTAFALPESARIVRDDVNFSNTNMKIGVIFKGYKIGREEWESFQAAASMANGSPIYVDTTAAFSAAQKVGEAEDSMIFAGIKNDGTNADIDGFLSVTGSTASGSSFGTYKGAITTVSNMMSALHTAKVYGMNYNLTLNPAEFDKLQGSVSTTGVSEIPKVLDMLNPIKDPAAGVGQVRMSTYVTAGTALFTPVDKAGRTMDLIIAQDVKNQLTIDPIQAELSPIFGLTYERLIPRIKLPAAVGTCTGCA